MSQGRHYTCWDEIPCEVERESRQGMSEQGLETRDGDGATVGWLAALESCTTTAATTEDGATGLPSRRTLHSLMQTYVRLPKHTMPIPDP